MKKKPSHELIKKYTRLPYYTLNDETSRREARLVYAYIRSHPELELPVYIKAGIKTYKRIDMTTKQERLDYARSTMKQWESTYYDTVLPMKKLLTKEELEEIHHANIINELTEGDPL